MDIIVLLINKHLKSIPLCFIFYVHLSNVFWFRNVLWLKNGIYLIKTIFKTFFPWNKFVKVCEARYMGHRVFHPVYYVLVMSEGQIIGLVWISIYITIIIQKKLNRHHDTQESFALFLRTCHKMIEHNLTNNIYK